MLEDNRERIEVKGVKPAGKVRYVVDENFQYPEEIVLQGSAEYAARVAAKRQAGQSDQRERESC